MPDKKSENQSNGESNFFVYMQIIKNKNFYTLAPVSAIGLASFFTIQGLWANGWMADVAGLSQEEVGLRLLIVAIAMSFGTLGNGALVDYLSKRGFNRAKYLATGLMMLFIVQIFFALNIDTDGYWQWVILGLTGNIGVLVHPILNKTYPSGYSARSISTIAVSTFLLVFIIQFGIGYVLDIWGPDEFGAYPVVAYNYAFGMLIIIEILFFSWMLLNIRRLKINF